MVAVKEHQCYTKCALNTPCTGDYCFCEGYFSGYDDLSSNAICGDETFCKYLCDNVEDCKSRETAGWMRLGTQRGDALQNRSSRREKSRRRIQKCPKASAQVSRAAQVFTVHTSKIVAICGSRCSAPQPRALRPARPGPFTCTRTGHAASSTPRTTARRTRRRGPRTRRTTCSSSRRGPRDPRGQRKVRDRSAAP